MNRRSFLTTTAGAAGALILPHTALAAMMDYSPGMLDPLFDNGETVFLDFFASWCGTCQAQRRVIESLWSENPDYEDKIAFVEVNWDNYGQSSLAQSLKIPRRSTLVAIGPDRHEIGRIIAGTGRDQIKGLMDAALAVATAAS